MLLQKFKSSRNGVIPNPQLEAIHDKKDLYYKNTELNGSFTQLVTLHTQGYQALNNLPYKTANTKYSLASRSLPIQHKYVLNF